MSILRQLIALVFLMLALTGCKKERGKAVHVAESEPENFVLSFQKPEVYEFTLKKDGEYDFALELTYYSEQMQQLGTSIPMYYILEGPGLGNGVDQKFAFPIKTDSGEWLGELLENEHDRVSESIITQDLELKAGKHTLKLYADSQKQGEPVQGMVKIAFQVLK